MIKICAKDFRSYPSFEWELPSGLTLLDGKNADTGGSNAAGKTTLLDAWFWARYGWLPKWNGPKGGPADAVIRRGSGSSCWVEITEKIGTDEIKYKRSRPAKLQVWVNGEPRKSIKQDEFEELLGMSAQRFMVCVYLPQKRRQSFYYMSDSERTELLSVISNLEKLDKGFALAKSRRDELKAQIDRAEGKRDAIKEALSGLPENLREAEEKSENLSLEMENIVFHLENAKKHYKDHCLQLDLIQKDQVSRAGAKKDAIVQEIELKINEAKQSEAEIKAGLDVIQERLASMPKLDPSYKERVDQIKKQIKDAEDFNSKQMDIIADNARWKEKLAEEMKKIEAAKKGTCNQCHQELPQEMKEKEILKYLQNAQMYESMIKQPDEMIPQWVLDELFDSIPDAEAAYYEAKAKIETAPADLIKEKNILEQRLSTIRADIEKLKTEVRIATVEFNHEVSRYSQERKDAIVQHYQAVEELEESLRTAETEYKWAIDKTKKISENIDQQKSLLGEINEELKNKKDEIDLQLDLIDLFGPKGYRSVCFDGLVERISGRAGQLLSIMTEGLYSTRIDQETNDSKGAQKMVLRPVLIKEGGEVPLDDLSGGAETRIALAYDVAVSEAAGEGMPLLLDETLEGLDAVGKEEAMFLLEEVSKTRSVIIVDHASEFKAMFNQVQEIVYENKESRLGELTIV